MALEVPTLTGRWVSLEPLAESHREGLRIAADDDRIWVHTLTNARRIGFDRWFDDTIAEHDAGVKCPFAVRQLSDGKLIGSTSYIDIHRSYSVGRFGSEPRRGGIT